MTVGKQLRLDAADFVSAATTLVAKVTTRPSTGPLTGEYIDEPNVDDVY